MLESWFGPNGEPLLLATAASIALLLAYLIADVAARGVRALLSNVSADLDATWQAPVVRRPVRITRALVFLIALAALAPPALRIAGAQISVGLELTFLTGWLFEHGVRVAAIALVTYLAVRVIAAVAHRVEEGVTHDASTHDVAERAKRARTLSRLVQNALTTVVLMLASLMLLTEFDIDVMPILTGAGILGLAVGFGAQTLVKDLISGFFIILENQVRVGDIAKINGTGGMVEAIRLRTIVLRDLEGVVHVFPNGSVQTLANLTKDFSFAVLDVGVAYKEDTDRVIGVLRDVAGALAADPQYSKSILEPLEVLGVDAFEDSQVTIKIRFKTVPLKQWEIGREFRRRIKQAFDAQDIEIPFPHVSVYLGEASQPVALRQVS